MRRFGTVLSIVCTVLFALCVNTALAVPAFVPQCTDARSSVSASYVGDDSGYLMHPTLGWNYQGLVAYFPTCVPLGGAIPAFGMSGTYQGQLKTFGGWGSTMLVEAPAHSSTATGAQVFLWGSTRKRLSSASGLPSGDYLMSNGYNNFSQGLLSAIDSGTVKVTAQSPSSLMYSIADGQYHQNGLGNGWGGGQRGYGYSGVLGFGAENGWDVVQNTFKVTDGARYHDSDVLGFSQEGVVCEYMDAAYPLYRVGDINSSVRSIHSEDGVFANEWQRWQVIAYGRNDMGGLPTVQEVAVAQRKQTVSCNSSTTPPAGWTGMNLTWNDSGAKPLLVHAPTANGGGIEASETYYDWWHVNGDPNNLGGFGILSPLNIQIDEMLGGGAGMFRGQSALMILDYNADGFKVGVVDTATPIGGTAPAVPPLGQIPTDTPSSSLFPTAGTEPSSTLVPTWMLNQVWAWFQNDVVSRLTTPLEGFRGVLGFVGSIADTSGVQP